jgi:hypothetical protein
MTKNTTLQNNTPQKKMANGRYEGKNYRYTDKFIKRMTIAMVSLVFIGPAIGFGLGALGDVIFTNGYSPEVPSWYTIMAISFVASGIALPLIIGAWVGAMAVNKYAGPLGLLLVFGLGASSYGISQGHVMWTWIGIGAMLLSTILLFYVGLKAKVPIWLQLPILYSPRFYITKDKVSNEDPLNVKNFFK